MSSKPKKSPTTKIIIILASICFCLIAILVPLVFLYNGRNSSQSSQDQIALAQENVTPATGSDETADSSDSGFDFFKAIRDFFGMGPSQEEMKEEVSARLNAWNSFVDEMKSTPLPDEMPQKELDELIAKAIDPDTESFFSSIDLTQDISEEEYEKAKAYTSFDNQYSRLLEVIDQIPYDYIWRLEEDWDRYDFTMAYIHQDEYQNPPATLNADLSSVPLIIQWDLDWAYCPYGDLNIAFAGCAPTCMSMVLSYLNQDQTLTPVVLAKEAEENGLYVIGAGSSHEIFPVLAELHGVTCTTIGADQSAIESELEQGHPVILNMMPGIFTRVGHFIVVTGIEDGKWVINDPNSIQRSNQLWDPKTVLAETATAWSFS